MIILNNFIPVDDLPVTFGLYDIEDEAGVFGFVSLDLFSIQKFQGIQHSRCLLGSVLPADCPECILCRLSSVAPGNQDGEKRILGCLIFKVRCKTDSGNGVDQIPEVDGFVRRQT